MRRVRVRSVRMGLVRMGLVRMNLVRMSLVRMNSIRIPGVRICAFGFTRRMAGSNHVYFGCRDAPTHHLAHFERCANLQCGGSFIQIGEGNAGVNQRAEQHVATNPGKTLQISDTHRQRF
jgi:hypothetical protein